MKKTKSKILVILALLFIFIMSFVFYNNLNKQNVVIARASWPTQYQNIADLTKNSDVIAIVKILSVASTYYVSNIPFTDFNAEVITSINGLDTKENIVITQTGIDSPSLLFEIEDDPLMMVGNEYLIFGYTNPQNTITINGGSQGRYLHTNGLINSLFNTTFSQNNLRNVEEKIVNQSSLSEDLLLSNVDAQILINEIKQYLSQ